MYIPEIYRMVTALWAIIYITPALSLLLQKYQKPNRKQQSVPFEVPGSCMQRIITGLLQVIMTTV